ncbi:hypothetical protein S83_038545, partial [Arachis hypogaea]
VNFLAKLVALKPRDTMLGMIRNVMQEKDEGVDNAGNDNEGNAERVSATGRKSHLVHPGMFLETVSNEFEVSRVFLLMTDLLGTPSLEAIARLLETAIDVRERRSFKISRLPYPFHLVLRAAILQHSKLAFALQLKRVMESDSALTEDLIAYNIIPLDAASSTNAFVSFPE